MEVERFIPLEWFQPVAIPGEGVWLVDDEGNGWHVGGPYPEGQDDNKLKQAYRDAVE